MMWGTQVKSTDLNAAIHHGLGQAFCLHLSGVDPVNKAECFQLVYTEGFPRNTRECLKTQTSSCHLPLRQLPCCYQLESFPWTPPCSRDCTVGRSDQPQTAQESSCPTAGHQHPDKHNTNITFQPATLKVSAKWFHEAHHDKEWFTRNEKLWTVSSYPSWPADSLQRETQTHNSSHVLHKGNLDAKIGIYHQFTADHRQEVRKLLLRETYMTRDQWPQIPAHQDDRFMGKVTMNLEIKYIQFTFKYTLLSKNNNLFLPWHHQRLISMARTWSFNNTNGKW